jgi:hypothetical protein
VWVEKVKKWVRWGLGDSERKGKEKEGEASKRREDRSIVMTMSITTNAIHYREQKGKSTWLKVEIERERKARTDRVVRENEGSSEDRR